MTPQAVASGGAVFRAAQACGSHFYVEPVPEGNPLRNDENHVWASSAQPPRVPGGRSACVTPVRRVPGARAVRPGSLVLQGEGAAEGAEACAMVAVLGARGHER